MIENGSALLLPLTIFVIGVALFYLLRIQKINSNKIIKKFYLDKIVIVGIILIVLLVFIFRVIYEPGFFSEMVLLYKYFIIGLVAKGIWYVIPALLFSIAFFYWGMKFLISFVKRLFTN